MRSGCMNPSTAIRRLARIDGRRTAIVADGRTLSFAELDHTVDALAGTLRQAGVGRGDRVGYLGLNSALFLQTLLATARLGAVFVPVNFRLTATEVEQIQRDSDWQLVIAEDEQRDLVAALPPIRCLFRAELDLDAASTVVDVETDPAEIAIIMYTSGTTGAPKGVVLSYANLWWNQANVAHALAADCYAASLAVAPLFHIGGLNAFVLGTLTRGGTVVVHRRFDAGQCLRDLERYRITSTFMVPTMFDALRQHADWSSTDLTSLSSAIVAGAPVPPGLVLAYVADGIPLQQAWGLTETAPFACHLPPAYAQSHPASTGYPMPYSEVGVLTADGQVVSTADIEGELCVRGPQVTSGYWRDAAATTAAIDRFGWFRTGDLGRLDSDGRCYVLDRIKDLIISGGENISPAEVERVLIDHPDVHDVAVVGVPDKKWGQIVVAAVAGVADIDELRTFAGARLAGYKLPSEVVPVSAIPRNGSGKIDRPGVRALVWSLSKSGRPSSPALAATSES